MGTGEINRGDSDWREAADEACAVLRAVVQFRLTAAQWRKVQEAVAEMAAAFAAVDSKSLWNAIAQLYWFGPQRVSTRLGDTPTEPVPEQVRERINELIDALVRQGSRDGGDRGYDGQESDGNGMSAG
jgi:hypothetical protein